ncbi:hypothetical protein [uncultured Flavobacterium sp.]|uniref:hypothetical protein n=1 Tax=uncultured Flavobacterium sp. TaxID=165435 RepID=UPI0030ED8143|tara:strand:+ start:13701 stop:14348 length:648 start_codon:yes stop_codon:yes gene_type:complete
MDKILAEQIQENFSEYKQFMIWILLGFAILIILSQYIYNLRLSKKIETFKGELKRNEITFSRYSELQIECLKIMYNHVVDLHFSFNNLLHPQFQTHDYLKEKIKSLIVAFNANMNYYHRNKILLTDDIIAQIEIVHKKFNLIKIILKGQLHSLSDLEELNESVNPQEIYGDPETEVSQISDRIKELNKNSEISTFEKDVKKMRTLVEKYFKELIK